MKLLLFFAVSVLACAQAYRVDSQATTVAGRTNPPGQTTVVTQPYPSVQVCSFPAVGVPCTNLATTYTDSTAGTACSLATQIVLAGTNACTGTGDASGNFGFWVTPAHYQYTISTASGAYGPYDITVNYTTILPSGAANLVIATPNGSSGVASLRPLVANDIPTGIPAANSLFTQTGTGAVPITTQNAIQVLGFTPEQFGAVGNGTADDTNAVKAAFAAAAAGNRWVFLPNQYGIISPITISNNMTGGRISGANINSGLIALSSFTGGAMLTSDGGNSLSDLTIENLLLAPNNVASVADALNLTFSPESSVRNHIKNVRLIGLPANANGLLMTGSEDSTVEDVSVTGTSGAGAIALNWGVINGNCNIINPTWFIQMNLQYQSCSITGGTIGTINTGSVAGVMTLNGVYSYANTIGPTTANIIVSASGGGQHNFIINGGLFGGSAGQSSALMFYGGFNAGRVQVNGAYITNGGAATYSVFNSATTGSNASFTFDGNYLVSATIGTPGSGVNVSTTSQPRSSYAYSFFPGAAPAIQTGSPIPNSFPIKITGIAAVSSISVSGCATPMVVGIAGQSSTYLTLSNGAAQWQSAVFSVPISFPGTATINVITAPSGCTNSPTNVQVTVEVQPQ